MKSVYVICALLGVTIGTLVLADNGAQNPTTRQSNFSAKLLTVADSSVITTPVPSNNTTNTTTTETTPHTTIPITKTTTVISTTPNPATSTPAPSTTTTTTTTINTTTPLPTTPTPPNTTSQSSTSTAIPTSTGASKTTAVPPAPPSKDRQFDGLSFFGGIILTTCLMAIAAFSWKFYRQCKEGNYRTL